MGIIRISCERLTIYVEHQDESVGVTDYIGSTRQYAAVHQEPVDSSQFEELRDYLTNSPVANTKSIAMTQWCYMR